MVDGCVIRTDVAISAEEYTYVYVSTSPSYVVILSIVPFIKDSLLVLFSVYNSDNERIWIISHFYHIHLPFMKNDGYKFISVIDI